MHSDNCILDEAHGVCHKEAPAYTWRDYRCVLEGGNTILAEEVGRRGTGDGQCGSRRKSTSQSGSKGEVRHSVRKERERWGGGGGGGGS